MELFAASRDFLFMDKGSSIKPNRIEKGSLWKLVGYNDETIVVACLKSMNMKIDGAVLAFKKDVFNKNFMEVKN